MFLLISVIIIVHNGEKFISKCLTSLMELDFPKEDLEIIVVDNNSTDRTKEIIQQFPVKYVFEPKMGPAAARNRGIKEAKGIYIAFIDSDCIADKFWIRNLIEPLRNDFTNYIGAVGGEIKFYSPDTLWKRLKVHTFISHEERCLGKGLLKRCLPHLGTANSIFKRHIFDEVGFFDENFMRGEDLDLCLRILLKGYKVRFIPQAIVYKIDYSDFLNDFQKKIIDGQNIAKAIYKYKDIFKYNILVEYIKTSIYDFLDIIDRYKSSVKEDRFRVSFLALSIFFCFIQNLSLLVGLWRYKGKVFPLPKSFVKCNKTITTMKININGKSLSYNTNIIPLVFGCDEEVTFIDLEKNSFYDLKGVGLEIWELMTQGRNIPEIIEIISLKYNIDKGIVETDLKDLLTEFKERNILI